jgi:hypothetical protein
VDKTNLVCVFQGFNSLVVNTMRILIACVLRELGLSITYGGLGEINPNETLFSNLLHRMMLSLTSPDYIKEILRGRALLG